MPGGGGNGTLLFNGYRVSILQVEKNSGNWLHNSVNVCNDTEVHTYNGYDGKFYVLYFYHN